MFRHRIVNHLNIYLLGLILLAVSLPLSKFITSVSIFILLGNWILEGEFKRKLNVLCNRVSILIFSSIVIVHVLWLFNTNEIQSGLHDIQIKLPLLALPLIIGTSKELTKKQLGLVLLFFIAAVTIASLIVTFIALGITQISVENIKGASIFIFHIRFSLMVDVAIFVSGFYIIDSKYSTLSWNFRIALIPISLWLIVFLIIFQTLTGILIFFVVGYFLVVRRVFFIKGYIKRYLLFGLLIGLIPGAIILINNELKGYYEVEEIYPDSLKSYTVNNNIYYHDPSREDIENGKYVWLYVCEKEMKKEWNNRSDLNYDGYDLKGQEIKFTLIRYLTSLGLNKDSIGIWSLSDSDINNIENGMGNHIYSNKFSIKALIYRIIWEFDRYKMGYNPSGNSLTQRIEYWKTGLDLVKDNFWKGVGTGDLQSAFDTQYEKNESFLENAWRLRAHNQFLSFLIAFGIFGFIYCIFALIAPVIFEKKYTDLLFMVIFFVAFFSFLNEDTLETHIGATFFAFFYSLLLFGRKYSVK